MNMEIFISRAGVFRFNNRLIAIYKIVLFYSFEGRISTGNIWWKIKYAILAVIMTCRVKSVLNARICSLPCILCLYLTDNAEVKSAAIKVHFTNNQLIQIYGFYIDKKWWCVIFCFSYLWWCKYHLTVIINHSVDNTLVFVVSK